MSERNKDTECQPELRCCSQKSVEASCFRREPHVRARTDLVAEKTAAGGG